MSTPWNECTQDPEEGTPTIILPSAIPSRLSYSDLLRYVLGPYHYDNDEALTHASQNGHRDVWNYTKKTANYEEDVNMELCD